jgi:hypothetical protein
MSSAQKCLGRLLAQQRTANRQQLAQFPDSGFMDSGFMGFMGYMGYGLLVLSKVAHSKGRAAKDWPPNGCKRQKAVSKLVHTCSLELTVLAGV